MSYSIFLSFVVIPIVVIVLLFYIGLKNAKTDWSHLWLNSLDGWLRIFCRYYHGFDFQNIPIPESGEAIIVSNHISGLDPILLVAATTRPIRFLIAREEYQRFGLTWLFRAGCCIPIDRSGNVIRAMSSAIEALNNGEIIAIFPEGVIHKKTQAKKPLKRGVVVLAEASNCSIYPVHITGVSGHGHVLRGIVFPGKVTLTAGQKISCQHSSHLECLHKIGKILQPDKNTT